MKTLIALLAALGAAAALGQPLTPDYAPLPGDAFLEARLLQEGNAARADVGLPPLAPEAGLTLAARHHAAEMAELGYFSHASPIAEHATLQHRLARAGSPLVTVGENLALLQGQPDLAAAAVEGWLDSPGHRANLLSDRFTHVGYGTATDARGATVVVQALAWRPALLLASDASPRQLEVRTLTLTVWSRDAVTALFSLSDAGDLVTELEPGLQQVRFRSLSPLGGSVQLRAGVALGDGSYLLEDAGWIEGDGGRWTPDPSTVREALTIERVEVEASERPGVAVRLDYAAETARALAVFVGGEQRREAVTSTGVALVLVADEFGVPVQVGLVDGGRVDIFHSFTLEAGASGPTLRPAEP